MSFQLKEPSETPPPIINPSFSLRGVLFRGFIRFKFGVLFYLRCVVCGMRCVLQYLVAHSAYRTSHYFISIYHSEYP